MADLHIDVIARWQLQATQSLQQLDVNDIQTLAPDPSVMGTHGDVITHEMVTALYTDDGGRQTRATRVFRILLENSKFTVFLMIQYSPNLATRSRSTNFRGHQSRYHSQNYRIRTARRPCKTTIRSRNCDSNICNRERLRETGGNRSGSCSDFNTPHLIEEGIYSGDINVDIMQNCQ